jgi:hypothetical protein
MIDAPSLTPKQCGQSSVAESLPLAGQLLEPFFIVVVGLCLQLPALGGACQSCQPASAAFADPMLAPSDSHRGPLARRF